MGIATWAGRLRREVRVIARLARDPRAGWPARLVALAVVAYLASPIDLIPDAIPVLGLLDDLIILPAGIWLVLRLVPPRLVEEHRAAIDALPPGGAGWIAAAVIVGLWLVTLGVIVWGVARHSWLFAP